MLMKSWMIGLILLWKNILCRKKPWWITTTFCKPLGKIVGALASEVTVMNTLTVNLHLLMVSFIDQQNQDIRSFAKKKAFPSDQYMFPKSSDFHGYKSGDAVEIKRREG
jgi:kynureninase